MKIPLASSPMKATIKTKPIIPSKNCAVVFAISLKVISVDIAGASKDPCGVTLFISFHEAVKRIFTSIAISDLIYKLVPVDDLEIILIVN